MSIVRLGPMILKWCRRCNVPVLEDKSCGICNSQTVDVKYTPPGDVRPAFPGDLEKIRACVDDAFGEGTGAILFPKDKIVVLNSAPATDKMDEVILDGLVLGSHVYDVEKGWKFQARLETARRLCKQARKGWLVIDEGAIEPILNGGAALNPGVLDCADGIVIGDEVLVLTRSRESLGVGYAKSTTEDMRAKKKGIAVRLRDAARYSQPDILPPTKITENGPRIVLKTTPDEQWSGHWRTAVAASARTMEKRAEESKRFIERCISEHGNLAVAVSYSGGKDSLATLGLVINAGAKPKVLFVNTGLELPETVENVHRVVKNNGLELLEESAHNAFEAAFPFFGPPGRDYRWCCKTCKLGPTTRLIVKQFQKGVLSFIGQRMYESEGRASKGSIWRNPWVPGQVGASPIQRWTAMHVWLYIFNQGLEYNPWYERGLDRIGCWLCPASSLAELDAVRANAPEKWLSWEARLKEYSTKKGFSDKWLNLGIWRWKKPPKPMIALAGDYRAGGASDCDGKLRFLSQEGYSPCTLGLSVEGAFSRSLDISLVESALNALGRPARDASTGSITVGAHREIEVFPEGSLVSRGSSEDEVRRRMREAANLIIRAHECVGCGICAGRCASGALSERFVIEASKCAHCGKCIGPCPVIDLVETAEFAL